MRLGSCESEAFLHTNVTLRTPVVAARKDGAMGRGWPALLCLGLTLGLLLWTGLRGFSAWSSERNLVQARRLMDADRFGEARQWLVGVPSRWSTSPEMAYRLGVCEHAAGNINAALAAWERVDPHSTWAMRAGLARARTLVGNLGRFSDGEAVLVGLLREPGPQREQVRHTLSELYFWEGRRDRMRRLIEENWELGVRADH